MEGFMNTMDANDEKINGVLQNADKLADEDHYNADKVGYVNISLYWFTHDSKSLKKQHKNILMPFCIIRKCVLHVHVRNNQSH